MAAKSIDATYGMRNTYTLSASCLNCGWEGRVRRAKGYVVIGLRFLCPHCGCSEVRAHPNREEDAREINRHRPR